jgi:glyoxylase I family protein
VSSEPLWSAPPDPDAPRLRLRGIHHVTLISRDLNATTAFYRDALGLTLVRQAANDDDPDARHFWFGDDAGTPGTLISFLEYPSMGAGTVGIGSTHHIAFAVGTTAELDGWHAHLEARGVASTELLERGGLRSLYVRDPDGHIVELVAPAGA